jgi:hypothetical protein
MCYVVKTGSGVMIHIHKYWCRHSKVEGWDTQTYRQHRNRISLLFVFQNKLCRKLPVVYRILDYLYYDREHNTFDVQLFIFYTIWLYYMFRP